MSSRLYAWLVLIGVVPGIIRCDMIAESIIGAAAELGPLRVPVVVRLQGTNSEQGLKLVSPLIPLRNLEAS